MLGTSEHAGNLFVRLSSYSPREDRDALEDFCSEALVWCLRESITFRKQFFELTGLDYLKANSDPIIHSQQRYEEDSEGAAAAKRHPGGRFDILFEGKNSSFFVALESKVGSAFGPSQIDRYLQRLASLTNLYPTMRCALITLTNVPEAPTENVKHIYWGKVHEQLEIASRAKPDRSSGESKRLFEILRQFADFLKLKGLAYMNIPRVNSASLNKFIKLRKGMDDIFRNLKASKHLESQLAGKRLKFELQGGDAYIGVYGDPEPWFFYMGFEFRDIAAPKMSLYIERSLKGKWSALRIPKEVRKNLRSRGFDRGQTWFAFTQPVDERLNGDAEAMRLWFHDISKLVLTLGEK